MILLFACRLTREKHTTYIKLLIVPRLSVLRHFRWEKTDFKFFTEESVIKMQYIILYKWNLSIYFALMQ